MFVCRMLHDVSAFCMHLASCIQIIASHMITQAHKYTHTYILNLHACNAIQAVISGICSSVPLQGGTEASAAERETEIPGRVGVRKLVRMLKANGADIDGQNAAQRTPLCLAAMKPHRCVCVCLWVFVCGCLWAACVAMQEERLHGILLFSHWYVSVFVCMCVYLHTAWVLFRTRGFR